MYSGTWRARPALGCQSRQPGLPAPGGFHHPEWVRTPLPACPPPHAAPSSLFSPSPPSSPLPPFPPDLDPLTCLFPSSLPDPPMHSGHLDAKAADGNSALHYAALYNQPDCLKLLLKGRAAAGSGGAPSDSPSPPPLLWDFLLLP